MTLVDLTGDGIAPLPQSTDVRLCTLTLPTVAEGDKCSMGVRESLGGVRVGNLPADGRFEIDHANSKITIWLSEKTAKWFKDLPLTEENRIKTLTGTFLHESKGGLSYAWSGHIDISFRFFMGYTRT